MLLWSLYKFSLIIISTFNNLGQTGMNSEEATLKKEKKQRHLTVDIFAKLILCKQCEKFSRENTFCTEI